MGFGGNNWGDPNSMAWLGMAQALGQAAMPSRMPVPNGAVFGALAGGLMQGAKSGYDMKKEQMQTLLFEAQADAAKRKTEMMPKFLKMIEDWDKGFGNPGAGTGAAQYAPSDTTDPGIVPSTGGAAGDLWGRVKNAEGGLGSSGESLVSPKGAIGVSQILPSTAREMAAKLKVPFDEGRLHTDQAYNEGLGKEYLNTLLTRYDGNEVLAAAAYNAGPSRVDEWVKTIGDPRTGNITDAGFISQIPIAETRNYVGKVAASSPRADLRSAGNQWLNQNAPFPTLANGVRAGAWSGSDFDPGNLLSQVSGPGAGGAPVGPNAALIPPPRSGINAPVAITPLSSQAAQPVPEGRRAEFLAYNLAHPEAPLSWDDFIKFSKPVSPVSPLTQGGALLPRAAPAVPIMTPAAAPMALAQGAPVGAPAMASRGPLLSPQALSLAKMGAMAEVMGFPNIAKPYETAYYNSPEQKAAVVAAETNARETAGFRFVGPKAQAEASGKTSITEPSEIRIAREKALLEQQLAEIKSRLDTTRALAEKGQRVNPTTNEIEEIPGAHKTGAAAEAAKTKAVTDITVPLEKQKLKLQTTLRKQEQDNAASLEPAKIRIGDQEFEVTRKRYADIVSSSGVPGQGGMQPGGALPLGRNIPAEELRAGQTKARIALDAKAAEDVGAHATLARRLMPLIDEVVRHADTTPQGWAGPVAASAARGFSAFGISVPSGFTNAELLESVSRQLIPLVREPGATSERELANYLKAVPGLMQSAEGRKKIAGMMKEVMQGSIDIANVYRENIGSPDLKEKLATLADERRAKLDREVSGGGMPEVGSVQQGYRFKGGNPADRNNWERAQ